MLCEWNGSSCATIASSYAECLTRDLLARNNCPNPTHRGLHLPSSLHCMLRSRLLLPKTRLAAIKQRVAEARRVAKVCTRPQKNPRILADIVGDSDSPLPELREARLLNGVPSIVVPGKLFCWPLHLTCLLILSRWTSPEYWQAPSRS